MKRLNLATQIVCLDGNGKENPATPTQSAGQAREPGPLRVGFPEIISIEEASPFKGDRGPPPTADEMGRCEGAGTK